MSGSDFPDLVKWHGVAVLPSACADTPSSIQQQTLRWKGGQQQKPAACNRSSLSLSLLALHTAQQQQHMRQLDTALDATLSFQPYASSWMHWSAHHSHVTSLHVSTLLLDSGEQQAGPEHKPSP
jgi:hypothetical protein